MNFYIQMLIKLLEKSSTAADSPVLKKLKAGYDLTNKDRHELEELVDSL